MTFVLIAPQVLVLSLATLISVATIMLIRSRREAATSAMENAYQSELARVSHQLDTVQSQLAQAFDACEKDQEFGKNHP